MSGYNSKTANTKATRGLPQVNHLECLVVGLLRGSLRGRGKAIV